jgi:hypothetical protein
LLRDLLVDPLAFLCVRRRLLRGLNLPRLTRVVLGLLCPLVLLLLPGNGRSRTYRRYNQARNCDFCYAH